MNAEKFTQKSLEAIKTAQDMALENNNIQIMPEHLMYALLDQEGGLIGSLFTKMGVDVNSTLAALDTVISGMPAENPARYMSHPKPTASSRRQKRQLLT